MRIAPVPRLVSRHHFGVLTTCAEEKCQAITATHAMAPVLRSRRVLTRITKVLWSRMTLIRSPVLLSRTAQDSPAFQRWVLGVKNPESLGDDTPRMTQGLFLCHPHREILITFVRLFAPDHRARRYGENRLRAPEPVFGAARMLTSPTRLCSLTFGPSGTGNNTVILCSFSSNPSRRALGRTTSEHLPPKRLQTQRLIAHGKV
jgi:hypothetical protein